MLNFSPLPDLRGTLPPLLEDLLTHEHNPIHRDIILTSVLPLLCACHTHIDIYYDRKFYELALYTCVVGETAVGKGRAEIVEVLGDEVDTYKSGIVTADGTELSLFHAFDVSQREMANQLAADAGRAYYYETEIEGITDNMLKEWGKIRVPLRKAWHHETIRLGRTDAKIRIPRPIINITLTGTSDQFKVLIPTTSKGLYSRFLLYHPQVPGRDHIYNAGPTDEIFASMQAEERIAKELLTRYKALKRRMRSGKPLGVWLAKSAKDPLWEHLRAHWDAWYQRIQDHSLTDMASVIKRANVQTLRTAALLTTLRLTIDELERMESTLIDERDFLNALALINIYIEHSIGYAMREYRVHKHTSKPSVNLESLLIKYTRMRYTDLAMEYTMGGKSAIDLERDMGKLEGEGKCKREVQGGVNWIIHTN